MFLELTGVKISNYNVQKLKVDPKADISKEFNPSYTGFNELVI